MRVDATMSHDEDDPFVDRLRRLVPNDPIDIDRMIYEAGRSAGHRQTVRAAANQTLETAVALPRYGHWWSHGLTAVGSAAFATGLFLLFSLGAPEPTAPAGFSPSIASTQEKIPLTVAVAEPTATPADPGSPVRAAWEQTMLRAGDPLHQVLASQPPAWSPQTIPPEPILKWRGVDILRSNSRDLFPNRESS